VQSRHIKPAPKSEMPSKHYDIKFDGFWREPNIGGIPANSGVYCVYVCIFDAISKTVALQKLVYIGSASNVKEAVAHHDQWPKWRSYLTGDEQICISLAPVGEADRERVAAALIYEKKPPANDQFKDNFPFPAVSITTSGRNVFLTPSFNVSRID
jgi:hypothetical protein